MDFKDEFDFISEKAKQLTDTGIRRQTRLSVFQSLSSDA